MSNYQRLNNIIGWAVFFVAAFVYLSTIEPTASFWDCGEYIATAFRLEVGHPPGAPLFQMLGRFFAIVAGDKPENAAMMINAMSGLSSAFTILFLFWTITAFGKKIAQANNGEVTSGKTIAIMGSGIVGALAYTFSDSFWFSAVEGEVYAMSAMFTAAVFWAILKWETVADQPHSERWIVLIAYMIGLSIGVHLLNLLAIPAIVFIYYFRKYKPTRNGILIASGLSLVLLGGVQSLVVPGVVSLAANIEIFSVNAIGLPYNIGTILYFIILIGVIAAGLIYTHKTDLKYFNIALGLSIVLFLLSVLSSPDGMTGFKRFVIGGCFIGLGYYLRNKQAVLNTILLCFTMLLIGYSSFIMLVIRSNANTPIDENNPENAVNLLSYLNREQYGDWPILYGQYYNAPLDPQQPYKDGNPVYAKIEQDNTGSISMNNVDGNRTVKQEDKYVIIDNRKNSVPNYDPRFSTVFPRMWSSQGSHQSAYKRWADIKGEKITIPGGHNGEPTTIVKPTFFENLKYFVNYQINWMYLRYFMWNFSGRQNDVQGHGNNITEGHWITGISFIDEIRLGKQINLPSSVNNNKARNAFYALPMLLGILGMFFHYKSHNKDFLVVLLLFFLTGLAIVIYLNQYPYQPRERDYAYAGSFYAFAIWIGLGAYAIFNYLKEKLSETNSAVAATVVCLLAVPTIMAKEGWDDHDRSNRYTARDFAINYLESCAPNAIVFTNGDNDTFPLWYVQEVEGVRTDVRVCNLSLLNTDWYIDQMKRKAYLSESVPFSLTQEKYRQGTRDFVPFYDRKIQGFISVKEIMNFISSERTEDKLPMQSGDMVNYLPTRKLSIPVDSQKIMKNGIVPPAMANRIERAINWELGESRNYIMKNDLMVLDLLAHFNWDRPIYFAVTTGPEAYLELQDYFQLEGLAYRLVPIKAKPEEQAQGSRVATDVMYNNIMNKFKWGNMDKDIYLDENILRMATNLRIQMGTLASALVNEGKKDSAIKVLDKCLAVMPEETVPFDGSVYSLIIGYYQAGGIAKANELSKKLFDIFEADLRFYSGLAKEETVAYGREIRQAQEIMQRLALVTESFKQDALSKEFEKRFMSLQDNNNLNLSPTGN